MKTITTIADTQSLAESFRREGKRIGFVPTMGFLHEGHLSLMRRARDENDIVVVSIFVNPTQFGPKEDLDRYPRDAEGDRNKCESTGADILFTPGVKEMYPEKPEVFVTVEDVSDRLEGAIRPGHFRGVATVVAKLFHIVKPHRAYFGQKDFQQCAVIRRMVKGLNLDVDVAVLPTVREPDGLAMSSRNSYLNADERRAATVLFRALSTARTLFLEGTKTPEKLKKTAKRIIEEEPEMIVDYVEIVDRETLAQVTTPGREMTLLVAAKIGKTRLIDNIML
ncbi:MAG: pantoate--beta-alanine ligase [Nitrospirae bacterium GWD2_57_9]|nr:MAG: pantoate--beta-alanine ligase [Nitrospirae bacterium GWD2_57_9]OGW45600.1 MAG: pantoate--beta-alanine ligase [Nitrospirae bacterium GWC2_57_9]